MPPSIFLILSCSDPILNKSRTPCAANFETTWNNLKKAAETKTNPGPAIKAPIPLKNNWINLLPSSGSKTLFKISSNLLAPVNRFWMTGPRVSSPILEPSSVSPCTSLFIWEESVWFNWAFFSKASLEACPAISEAFPKTEVSLDKSFKAAETMLIW